MITPNLSRFVRPCGAAILGVSAALLALHGVGGGVVASRFSAPPGQRLAPLIVVIPATLMLLAARFLWTQCAGDRWDQRRLWGTAALFAAGSYLISLRAESTGNFHGLVTPVPGSSFTDDHPGRPALLYTFNAHGFRVPEWPVKKAPGTIRVALVGDSFVFGYGVEERGTLSAKPRWDAQDERRESRRVGMFSLTAWALGVQTAVVLWDIHDLAFTYTDEGARLLREQMNRLEAFRATHGKRPLLVLPFQDAPAALLAPIREMPGALLLPPVERRPEYFIPGDGHPTSTGNHVFAAMLADALTPWISPPPAR